MFAKGNIGKQAFCREALRDNALRHWLLNDAVVVFCLLVLVASIHRANVFQQFEHGWRELKFLTVVFAYFMQTMFATSTLLFLVV